MSSQNSDIKNTITKIVQSTIETSTGKKSTGTVISTTVRDIPIILVESFSQ